MYLEYYVISHWSDEVEFQRAPWYYGVVASIFGVAITHPLDLVGVNVQANCLKFVSHRQVVKKILSKHGLSGLYYAFPGAALKNLVHCSSSFLILRSFDKRLIAPTVYDILLLTIVSGISAGAISTPFVKVSVVSQAELTRDRNLRRNFNNTWSALRYLYMKGGWSYLYQGARLQTIHGTIITLGEIMAFRKMKMLLKTYQRDQAKWKLYFLSMTLSSGLIHFLLTPIKIVRNVVMNADYGEYKSSLDAWKHIKRVHGYKGFTIGYQATVVRIVPHSFMVAYIYELLIRSFLL